MKIQSLNGIWDYRIGKGEFTSRKVPYSDLPVGMSECAVDFEREEESERAFLVFEGITYKAEVFLNGEFLGEMLPYCRYVFEITDTVKKNNRLSVKIYDIGVLFGPTQGWQNYSGIIRDVYIEYTGSNVITETTWKTKLNKNYNKATVTLKIDADIRDKNVKYGFELWDKTGKVRSESRSRPEFGFEVENPHLWSTDEPYLYTLLTYLEKDGKKLFCRTEEVGFKELCIKNKKFYLNGKKIFLLGVCKHDLFGYDGHTLTEEQLMRDMTMIKSTGANFVRLVHYPHNKKVIEIADEIGLLVSEEPGLWWSDMNNEEICKSSLSVLEKTIKRDKNHVSVAFWLSFNECVFTPEYLKASAEVCRKNDDTRMVSGANCMSLEMTKRYYPECGFDFYTMHPYDTSSARITDSINSLTELPLVFTEWGGYPVLGNNNLLREFIRTIVEYWKNDNEPTIAGAFIWNWAEMNEHRRGEPACSGGIQREGLVDMFRNPTPAFEIFKDEFAMLYREEEKEKNINVVGGVNTEEIFKTLEICCPKNEKIWDDMLENARKPITVTGTSTEVIRQRNVKEGPVLPEKIERLGKMPVSLSQKPFIISDASPIEIDADITAKKLYIIGAAGMLKGYPLSGAYGAAAASMTIIYKDGEQQKNVLKNGIDITCAESIFGPSKINPTAEKSKRVIEYSYDIDYEQYVVNMSEVNIKEKEISKIIFSGCGNGYNVLLYGITAAREN